MTRLADSVTAPRKRPGPPCSIRIAKERMEREDPELLADIIAWENRELRLPHKKVYNDLQNKGYRVAFQTVGKHLLQYCECWK